MSSYVELTERIKHLTADHSDVGQMINRRADVENYLISVAQGKLPPPTAEDCKVLALRLGTPRKLWSDYVKQYRIGGE